MKRKRKKKGNKMPRSKPTKPAQDEVGRLQNVCPWCNYSNKDPEKGPIHEKENNIVVNQGTSKQCMTCGKNWKVEDLKQPWTLGLERGADWVRAMQARNLREA